MLMREKQREYYKKKGWYLNMTSLFLVMSKAFNIP